jgi:Lrp/AsnC family transcriptional regulator for asnA, asnC and gidA
VRNSSRIDDVDKQLIALLQVDGRLSYVDLARQVGVSEAIVRHRVARLRADGAIQIVAVTDPLQLGFDHEAMVMIQSGSDASVVADELAEIEEVDFIVLVGGKFDILLEVVAADDEEFLAVIQRIRNVVRSGTVQVMPYLKTWMQAYAWGTR